MKKILMLVSSLLLVISFTGCTVGQDYLINQKEQEITSLEKQIEELTIEKQTIENQIQAIRDENDIHEYVIVIKIKQSHFTLDIDDHIKDALNEITLPISVSKEYYNSINIGDELSDEFRLGSLVMKGSIGSWKVTVEDKKII